MSAPSNLQYDHGAVVFATFASTATPGSFEVYCANTTGWEPLEEKRGTGDGAGGGAAGGGAGAGAAGSNARTGSLFSTAGSNSDKHPKLTTTVLRTTTTDFKTYSPYKAVLQFNTGGDPYPYVGTPRRPLHDGRSTMALPRGPLHGEVADHFLILTCAQY